MRAKPAKHPGETDECDLTEPRNFNLMFETTSARSRRGLEVYLRPETAQGIFINFKNVLQFARKKPPFGIAQIGKSFRNEITPGNFIFRTREFEQMEMEFFVPPAEAPQWYEHWIGERERWYTELGLRPDHLRLRAHDADELSHYSSGTSDVEYLFPIGWSELEGIANRGDFDLTQHAKFSGEKLEYFDQQTKERYVPHVIEPAAGADRATLAFLVDAYERKVEGGARASGAPCCACTRASPRSRSRYCRSSTRRACRRRRGRSSARCASASRPSSTRAARSASATAARTRSAPPGASPSTSRRGGRHRDPARPRLAGAGPGPDRGPRRGARSGGCRPRGRRRSSREMAGRNLYRQRRSDMDFDLTDEQRLIRDTAKEFTDKEIVERTRENARNHHFDTDLVKKVAAQGYLGAIVPPEYGGAGLDYFSYGLVVEEIGRGDSAIRTVISVQTSLVCSASSSSAPRSRSASTCQSSARASGSAASG